MKNRQKLDGLQWIGIVCFVVAFPIFVVGVMGDMIALAILGFLSVGAGAVLFSVSKQKKKKMFAAAQNLIASAQSSAELANGANDINDFLSYYDSLLSETRRLIAYEGRVPFSLNPSVQYDIFVSNKQWHTRDAIERHYSNAEKLAKTTYRNSRDHVESLCRIFAGEIEENKGEFDEETMAFAVKLRDQLFMDCDVINTYSAADRTVRC